MVRYRGLIKRIACVAVLLAIVQYAAVHNQTFNINGWAEQQRTVRRALPTAKETGGTLHHHYCTITTAPSLHHHCTVTAPSLHHHCTITAPSLHHHCTITASSLHHDEGLATRSLASGPQRHDRRIGEELATLRRMIRMQYQPLLEKGR